MKNNKKLEKAFILLDDGTVFFLVKHLELKDPLLVNCVLTLE